MSGAPFSSQKIVQIDPLLQDLNEKKQNFRRNVVSLAAELKDARSRLASKEEYIACETRFRQVAETKAKGMEDEVCRLRERLQEKDGQIEATHSAAEQYLKEFNNLRSQLSATQATADASAASAQAAQLQCSALLRDLDEKNISIKQHEDRVNKLGEQLDLLQTDLQARELTQKQLKEAVLTIEQDIMRAVTKAGVNKDCDLWKLLGEVSPKNIERINKFLNSKDEEIARLKDEIRVMSVHWKFKTKELDAQLVKHRRADQELKKRVLKLEFCLQEARSQIRKLQRMGEQRDKALQELRDQLAMEQESPRNEDKQNFWESSGFKIVVSMSMLVLVVFAKSNLACSFVVLPFKAHEEKEMETLIWRSRPSVLRAH